MLDRLRLDAGSEAFAQLTDKINQGEPSIPRHTDAQGHHFPDVTLVAILDADIGLFSPDFRGQEQMIQTIVQVAGRAGRADKTGEVVIQTRHAEYPGLNRLMTQSYEQCARSLLQERQLSRMPPFTHLCLLRIESAVAQQGVRFARQCYETAFRLQQQEQQIELIGPLPAPMEEKQVASVFSCTSKGRAPGCSAFCRHWQSQLGRQDPFSGSLVTGCRRAGSAVKRQA